MSRIAIVCPKLSTKEASLSNPSIKFLVVSRQIIQELIDLFYEFPDVFLNNWLYWLFYTVFALILKAPANFVLASAAAFLSSAS